MSTNPFGALGLPTRPDLTDEQVRAAWRATATATHPDRADGGDVARYTAATAAYVTLRTPWGRSEAYADVVAAAGNTMPLAVVSRVLGPGADADLPSESAGPVGPGALFAACTWQLPTRIRYGRPVRLAIRGAVAALLCLGVLALVPGQPVAPALVAALITWFVITGRSDLAPPRHR